jgi:hypothetical protein
VATPRRRAVGHAHLVHEEPRRVAVAAQELVGQHEAGRLWLPVLKGGEEERALVGEELGRPLRRPLLGQPLDDLLVARAEPPDDHRSAASRTSAGALSQ